MSGRLDSDGAFFRRARGLLTLFTSPLHGDSVAILAAWWATTRG